ncbi:TetR/AcrR family transcriptional regulator [Streptomyces echinatus]|uniref:AcrR family transcriptional regulator n=1 Tax=Streptomyces echinatus TaxID=67293 RepID=A0A7W9PQW9_9ACTN|nr:TetR/AcrR family transcriptional regulator [Streptomyces echinatus]MBB5925642.1 AcrR family transcriptional regulator [Streptomyces echinatus]
MAEVDAVAPTGRPGERGDTAALEAFREQQRVDIANALIELVAGRGFAAANVSDLVRAVGMSRKTYYKYFASIEAALMYAQQMILKEMRAEPEPRPEPGLRRFMAQLRAITDFASKHPQWMIFISFVDFAVKDHIPAPDREAYDAFTVSLLEDSLSAFEQGQRDGSIDPALPALETTIACTNAVFGLAQRCANSPAISQEMPLFARLIDAELRVWEGVLTTGTD